MKICDTIIWSTWPGRIGAGNVVEIHGTPCWIAFPTNIVFMLTSIGVCPRLLTHVAPFHVTCWTRHVGARIILLAHVTATRANTLTSTADDRDKLVLEGTVQAACKEVLLQFPL